MATMKTAGDAVSLEVTAGGDHFDFERIIAAALDLAQVGWSAGTHQGLEAALGPGAHDFDLEVATARGLAGIVGGPTECRGARVVGTIVALEHGERARRQRQRLNRVPTFLNEDESVCPKLQRLRLSPRRSRRRAGEPVSPAACGPPFLVQIATGDVKNGLHVEVTLAFPQLEKIDVLCVAQQPGRLVIERLRAFLELADAERDSKASALDSETPARRCGGGRGERSHREPKLTDKGGQPRPTSLRRGREYYCALVKGFTRMTTFLFWRRERRCV